MLIGSAAVGPDLTGGSGERAEIPHLHHGVGEIRPEGSQNGAISPDLSVGGTAAEELLVWVQQSPLVHQVAEVWVVKPRRTRHIQRRQVVVATAGGTVCSHRRQERRVDVVLIEPRPKCCAPGLPDCVPPWTKKKKKFIMQGSFSYDIARFSVTL